MKKRTMRWLGVVVAGLALAALVGCRQGRPPSAQATSAAGTKAPPNTQPATTADDAQGEGVGRKAPDFSVTDVDGKAHNLKDYAGKILVVDFWATYCKPCIEHLRDYNDAQYELSKQGVVFLALSMDDRDEVIRGWRPDGFDIPLARLDPGTQKAFFGDMPIVAIPQVRIVDRKGIVRYSFGPEVTSAQVKDAIKALVEER